MAPSIANATRFILCLGAAVASVRAQAVCSDPSVRREWRALSVHEKAEWIEAVKVCSMPFSRVPLRTQTPPIVPVDATSRSQSGHNATGECDAHSAYQPGFVVL